MPYLEQFDAALRSELRKADSLFISVEIPGFVMKLVSAQLLERRKNEEIMRSTLAKIATPRHSYLKDSRISRLEQGTFQRGEVYEILRLCELLSLDTIQVFLNALDPTGDVDQNQLTLILPAEIRLAMRRRDAIRRAWTAEFF